MKQTSIEVAKLTSGCSQFCYFVQGAIPSQLHRAANRTTRQRIARRLFAALAALAFVAVLVGTPASLAKADTDKPEKILKQATKSIRSGKFEQAIELYKTLLAQDSQNLSAHLGIALTYLKMLDYASCHEHAQEALKIDEKSARAHALAGMALLRSGYVANAIVQLNEAFKFNSKESLAFGAAAEIDYYEGRSKDSRQKALFAYYLDPYEPDFLITVARASSRLELFAEAAEAYDRFLRIAPRTDAERRDRIRGLIEFYRHLAGLRVHQVNAPPVTDIPFKLGTDRRPYLKLKINGRDAIFVIDTGSGFTVISKEAAKKFGVSEIARGGNSQGFGGTGKFPIVYGLIKSLEMGDVKIKSVPCFIRVFHGMQERPIDERADGFIGLSILSHFITELDYKGNLIRLDTNVNQDIAATPSPDVTVVPFRTTQNGLISIETQLDGGHRVNAILDSGASSTAISIAAIDRLNLRSNIIKGQFARVSGAAGIAENVELIFLRNCKVADLEHNNVRALVLDFGAVNETSGFEQSGILGGDFLRNFRVKIDFNRTLVALQPHTPLPPKPLPDKQENEP